MVSHLGQKFTHLLIVLRERGTSTVQRANLSMNSEQITSQIFRSLLFICGFGILIVLSACSGTSSDQSLTPPDNSGPTRILRAQPDDPQSFLKKALDATFNQESFRFRHEFRATVIEEGFKEIIRSTSAGAFQAPGRLHETNNIEITTANESVELKTETISIGTMLYTKNIETGEWDVGTGLLELTPEILMISMNLDLSSLDDLHFGDDETVDGRQLFHLIAKLGPGVDIGSLNPALSTQVEYWVEADTLLIVRFAVSGSGFGDGEVKMNSEYSDYGETFEILSPVVSTPGNPSP